MTGPINPGTPGGSGPVDPFDPAGQGDEAERTAFLNAMKQAQLQTNHQAKQIASTLRSLQRRAPNNAEVNGRAALAGILGGAVLRINEDGAIPLASRSQLANAYLDLAGSIEHEGAFRQRAGEMRDAVAGAVADAFTLQGGGELPSPATSQTASLAQNAVFDGAAPPLAGNPVGSGATPLVLAGVDHANAKVDRLDGRHDAVASGLRQVQALMVPLAIQASDPAMHPEIREVVQPAVQSLASKVGFLSTMEPVTPQALRVVRENLDEIGDALGPYPGSVQGLNVDALHLDLYALEVAARTRQEPQG